MSSVVPKGWRVEKIEDLALDKKGAIKIGPFGSALSKREMVSRGVKVYGQENVYRNNFSLGSYYITDDKYKSLESCTLKKGDVVVSMMGTVGASAIFPEGAEMGIMDSHLLRIQADTGVITPEFLRRQISDYEWVASQIERMSQGGIMSGLNATIVKSVRVIVPSLPEQKKIASILTSVDEVIENTQKQIDKLQDLKKATMNELLTKGIGHTEFKDSELGRIPKSWEEVSIGDLVEQTVSGASFSPSDFSERGVKVIPKKALQFGGRVVLDAEQTFCKQQSYERFKKSAVTSEHLIVVLRDLVPTGPSIGLMGVFEGQEELLLAQGVYGLALNELVLPLFLSYFSNCDLYRSKMRKLFVGSTQIHIRLGELLEEKIAIPSIDEQREIVDVMEALSRKLSAQTEMEGALRRLKRGLMRDLLSGHVRVAP